LYSFKSSDGTGCRPGLNLANDGNFYGHCLYGGSGSNGSLYKVTPTGTLTILHAFTGGADGGTPNGPPIQATDGNLYGTTTFGGANNLGIVYKSTLGGTLTTLYSFKNSTDGYNPVAPLVQGTDGNLYGSAQFGGAHGGGTIFKISTAGKLTVQHAFTGTDGSRPISAMIQGTDGNFYGTTYVGGANNQGVVFKMTASGTLTVLHSFSAATDGEDPEDAMVQATDGNFYGVANGNNGGPTSLYKVTLKGVFSRLYLFDGTIGSGPVALVQHTDGLLYGDTTTGSGTGQSNGIFYSWSIGAAPFLRLALTSGKVGTLVGMFGQGFDSSSVVKFGGVQAKTFTLTGTTYITATVPAGAVDGYVTVTTGSTTLTSTKTFTVHDSWSIGKTMPTARFGAFAGAIGTNIYVVGGATNSGYQVTNVNEIYNTQTNTWKTGAPLPTARELGASAVVKGILYVVGGSTGGSNPQNVVEAYNPVSNTWTTKAPMPTARNSMPAAVYNNIIYVIGGYDPNTQVWYDVVESYNPSTDTWTEEAPLPVATAWEAVGLLGSTIVSADGQISPGTPVGSNDGYNPKTNTWTGLTADATPRLETCFAAISGQLYVAGGANATQVLNVNEAYSATTKKWTTLASMPNALETPGSATVGGRLYCVGGSSSNLGSVYNYVQIYQP
jgi:uncharacterized repeat protein (TIGR03803 family)